MGAGEPAPKEQDMKKLLIGIWQGIVILVVTAGVLYLLAAFLGYVYLAGHLPELIIAAVVCIGLLILEWARKDWLS